MKTLLVAQQKGGVGKTATAAHIIWHAAEQGLRVLVLDLDTGNLSRTLSAWHSGLVASQLFVEQTDTWPAGKGADIAVTVIAADKALANLAYMPLDRAIENFRVNLVQLAGQGFDVCVIDTPPSMGVALAAALHAADAVITPLEVEDYSVQGIQDMIVAIVNARKRNPALQFLGLVPSRVDGRNPRQMRNLQQLQAQQAQLLSPVVIGLRSAVADALASGMPVWKIRKTTARIAGAEMRALGAYALDKMGVSK